MRINKQSTNHFFFSFFLLVFGLFKLDMIFLHIIYIINRRWLCVRVSLKTVERMRGDLSKLWAGSLITLGANRPYSGPTRIVTPLLARSVPQWNIMIRINCPTVHS